MADIEISVYCLAYNCVKFIERSIDGMLNQKVNVNYKIIIHDDASTDGTADIIKKYAAMYPQKIHAILQTENQYSKGIDIVKQFIFPNIEGKYIALCEGDDYWIDKNKLQLQYDYMEQHPECSLCTHNTVRHNLKTNRRKNFNQWKQEHVLTAEETFLEWCVHTSSYFLRKNCVDWSGTNYWFGDYMMLTWSFYRGQVICIPHTMSEYHSYNQNGVTFYTSTMETSKWIYTWGKLIEYLNEYNEITHFKFDKTIQKKIKRVEFQCFQKECDSIILSSHSKEDCIDAAKKMISHKYYPEYMKSKKGIHRIIRKYRYEGYLFYPLWKHIMNKALINGL